MMTLAPFSQRNGMLRSMCKNTFFPLRSTSPRVPTLLVVAIPAFQNKIDSVRQSPRHSMKQQRRRQIQARRGTIRGRGSPWRKPDRIGGDLDEGVRRERIRSFVRWMDVATQARRPVFVYRGGTAKKAASSWDAPFQSTATARAPRSSTPSPTPSLSPT
jgi:hypothetical protein